MRSTLAILVLFPTAMGTQRVGFNDLHCLSDGYRIEFLFSVQVHDIFVGDIAHALASNLFLAMLSYQIELVDDSIKSSVNYVYS